MSQCMNLGVEEGEGRLFEGDILVGAGANIDYGTCTGRNTYSIHAHVKVHYFSTLTSCGNSCSRSRDRMWSRVSIDGESPPCKQKICVRREQKEGGGGEEMGERGGGRRKGQGGRRRGGGRTRTEEEGE